MEVISLEDIGKHYVSSLSNLRNKLDPLAQDFTDNFIRMWRLYFCYSAIGFKCNYISHIHALCRKRI